jgi:hypothetical protein
MPANDRMLGIVLMEGEKAGVVMINARLLPGIYGNGLGSGPIAN